MLLCISHRGRAEELTTKCFVKESKHYKLYGVFDGQNGVEAAEFASQFLKSFLVHNLSKLQDFATLQEHTVKRLLSNAFTNCQQRMLISEKRDSLIRSSASSCIVLKIGSTLYSANCGDTLAYVVDKEGVSRLISKIHTLRNSLEKVNIIETGGWYSNGIICDKTHLTRALGNLWQVRSLKWHKSNNLKFYDQPMDDWDHARLSALLKEAPPAWCIDCTPSVEVVHLGPEDMFLSIQTDGMRKALEDNMEFLWSSTPEKAISKRLKETKEMSKLSNLSIIAFDCGPAFGPEDHIAQKICDENLET